MLIGIILAMFLFLMWMVIIGTEVTAPRIFTFLLLICILAVLRVYFMPDRITYLKAHPNSAHWRWNLKGMDSDKAI
jgi:hypothetical protein